MNPTYLGDISLDEETLTHYGVLGMKWGVRKDPQRAWAKANTELAKRRKKSGERTKKKVARLSRKAQKANKKASKRFSTEEQKAKAFKANYKLDKAMKKSAKADRRTARWERQMDKAFANTKFAKVQNNKGEETLSNRKVQKIKKDYETKSKVDKSRYQTMTIKTKKGQDDYTIDTKYNAIVSKSSRDKKGNTLSKQRMSDSDIAISKKTISELRSKQNKQWNRNINKDFNKLGSNPVYKKKKKK